MTSHNQSRSCAPKKTTENVQENFSVSQPTFADRDRTGLFPGGQNDAATVRNVLVECIRACGKSRSQIADEMTHLAGRKVTERMLNNYTAESRADYPFPLDLVRPFCTVTKCDEPLRQLAKLHGLRIIDAKDAELVELGRAFLQRTQAEEQIDELQRRLKGRAK